MTRKTISQYIVSIYFLYELSSMEITELGGGGGLAYLDNVQLGTTFFSLKVSLTSSRTDVILSDSRREVSRRMFSVRN